MSHGLIPALALLAWIPLAVYWFSRHPTPKGVTIALLSAALFLPVHAGFDLPLLPTLGKINLSFGVVLFLLLAQRPRLVRSARLFQGPELLFGVLVLGHLGTWITNRDPLVYGVWERIALPGLSLKDALSGVIWDAFGILFPFLIGRIAFQTTKDVRSFMRVWVGFCCIYAVLILFEVRFSPQLHRWVYGYHAFPDFGQAMRWGGYRPLVFTYHGLVLAFMMFLGLVFAASLYRARRPTLGIKGPGLVWALTGLLVLVKSTGVLVYSIVLIPLQLLTKPRTQLRVAVVVALIALTYPYTRSQNLFPTDKVLELALSVSAERAGSLGFRFDNEDVLLEKVSERSMFGWGGYGRNRVYDDWGKDISVTDGYWIIRFGAGGLVGMLVPFLWLTLPVLLGAWRLRRCLAPPDRPVGAGLVLALAMCAIEQLPNAMTNGIPFVIAGAVSSLFMRPRPVAPFGDARAGPPAAHKPR